MNLKRLVFFAVSVSLNLGCATAKFTVSEDMPTTDCKAGDKKCKAMKATVEVTYKGTASGARELVEAETHRRQAVTSGNVAQTAADQGKPVSLNTTPGSQNLSTGYVYGYGYGGYGALNPFAFSEAASFGHVHGSLPKLGEMTSMVQPGQSISTGANEQMLRDIRHDQLAVIRQLGRMETDR